MKVGQEGNRMLIEWLPIRAILLGVCYQNREIKVHNSLSMNRLKFLCCTLSELIVSINELSIILSDVHDLGEITSRELPSDCHAQGLVT